MALDVLPTDISIHLSVFGNALHVTFTDEKQATIAAYLVDYLVLDSAKAGCILIGAKEVYNFLIEEPTCHIRCEHCRMSVGFEPSK